VEPVLLSALNATPPTSHSASHAKKECICSMVYANLAEMDALNAPMLRSVISAEMVLSLMLLVSVKLDVNYLA